MKKLIETIKHIWAIDELRKRITYTLMLLVIYRLGSYIILPGIDSDALEGLNNQTKNNILGLINTFAGGHSDEVPSLHLVLCPISRLLYLCNW